MPITIVIHRYRRHNSLPPETIQVAVTTLGSDVTVTQETVFNIGLTTPLTDIQQRRLEWLLAETFDPNGLTIESHLKSSIVVEVGPRLNFQTAWSSNAVSICHACGINSVIRLERSRRYAITTATGISPNHDQIDAFTTAVYDRMTEQVYKSQLRSFDLKTKSTRSYHVPVLLRGAAALREASSQHGLGFDDQDIKYYEQLFREMGRDPTNVELFDLAQSNSEHSRHWFFRGKLVIDGKEIDKHLLDIVRDTLEANPTNSVVAFADNSSTIRGASIKTLVPKKPGFPAPLVVKNRDRDVLFTAETHNFPSGVAPFPGAETGTGGRIRDTAATGIGSLVVAGTAGYAVGNLNIPNYPLEWEDKTFGYPDNLASPLNILIQASNGASDYGNKFGEPVINGFARSYGMRYGNGERREYVKPIMFSGGMGQMEHSHAWKGKADIDLLVVKVGGPAYRIGMGGGAASSMLQGDNKSDLDFDAVQRGDAEMAQKVYRVLRACVEMGDQNPIISIHDQGAGGNCNVVKELIYPGGAKIDVRNVWVGDKTLSALEIWGAEYQEQFGLLLKPKHEQLFRDLCKRENVVPAVLGSIDGSGRIVLWDEQEKQTVVDMDLEAVLGDLPQKTFVDSRSTFRGDSLKGLQKANVKSVLDRVLRLMGVGSKRFLTTKVDRSVTGLVAQQQCVGRLQIPLSDYAVTALSHFTVQGSATAIGERPALTSLSPAAMARMSVAEMMTNIAGVKLSSRKDIKCEGNWMWAAKLPGDCASLYDAAVAMRDIMIDLNIAIDGGKDSLSMAAKCPSDDNNETVRAPGTLVITGYCTVDDVQQKLTPDIKTPGNSVLIHVDISSNKRRLGGSAASQVYSTIGIEAPDIDDTEKLNAAFDLVQYLIGMEGVLSYHDISDGGLLVAILEMGFAGNCGLDIKVDSERLRFDPVSALFSEEAGMLLEVSKDVEVKILGWFRKAGLSATTIANTNTTTEVTVFDGKTEIMRDDIRNLRDVWEETSFELEKQQANITCVKSEQEGLKHRQGLQYVVPWAPKPTAPSILNSANKPKVAIIREEGSNGDREMSAAFYMTGFDAWDVSINDLANGRVHLDEFCGVAFVGGFSYADVLDSAKGWAGVVRFNDRVHAEFDAFYNRTDTFSLGVCNGCQLMALLGRVPFCPLEVENTSQPRFIHNASGRYESRFTTVKIEENTPSIMLQGMGGGQLGVWVAHGEGRAYFPDHGILEAVEQERLAPIRYVDDNGNRTQTYPANPNGSTHAIAALCSSDGRHLAIMPHPERTILQWQWGYLPQNIEALQASPWLTMFQNAYNWVTSSM